MKTSWDRVNALPSDIHPDFNKAFFFILTLYSLPPPRKAFEVAVLGFVVLVKGPDFSSCSLSISRPSGQAAKHLMFSYHSLLRTVTPLGF